MESSAGLKFDQDKPQPWLVIGGFSAALEEVAKVATFGAEKYTPDGWKHVQDGQRRYMEAFARHMLELGKGEIADAESARHHKAHMIWNLLASLELELSDCKLQQLNPKS